MTDSEEYIKMIIQQNHFKKDRIEYLKALGYKIVHIKIKDGKVGLIKYLPRKKIKVMQIGWYADKSVCVILEK